MALPDLFVRVRIPFQHIQTACEQISTKVDKMVVYQHEPNGPDGDNIHVHMYLRGNHVSTDTLKNYIKKCCPKRDTYGNSFWSFNTAYDDGCIVYMSKGILMPSYVKGYSACEIEEYRLKYDPSKEKKKTYQAKLTYVVKETPAQSKKRKNDLIDEMRAEIKNMSNSTQVITGIVKVLNDNNVVFGRYTVRDYYDTLQSRFNTESFVSQMENFVVYKT